MIKMDLCPWYLYHAYRDNQSLMSFSQNELLKVI